MDRTDRPGATAAAPTQIPPRGWWQVAKRTWREMAEDHLSMVAAGLAYYAMFALFPALAAVVSIWGVFADPQELTQQLNELSQALPAEIATLIGDQLRSIATSADEALGLAAIVGLLVALYSASKGMRALIEGLNIAYDEDEERGFFGLLLTSLGLTLLGIVFVLVAVGLVAVLPPLLDNVGLGDAARWALKVGRWPLLGVAMMALLALVYRFGPSRDRPQWQWASPGAVVATVLWLVVSALFSLYVGQFGNYNETYGALGAVIVLLLWLWMTGYLALAGAELNAELEHQTERDTTRGPEEPMGERGAYVADTVPEEP